MTKDTVIDLEKPEPFVDDPIAYILRSGARRLLAGVLEAEKEIFLSQYADLKMPKAEKELPAMDTSRYEESKPALDL